MSKNPLFKQFFIKTRKPVFKILIIYKKDILREAKSVSHITPCDTFIFSLHKKYINQDLTLLILDDEFTKKYYFNELFNQPILFHNHKNIITIKTNSKAMFKLALLNFPIEFRTFNLPYISILFRIGSKVLQNIPMFKKKNTKCDIFMNKYDICFDSHLTKQMILDIVHSKKITVFLYKDIVKIKKKFTEKDMYKSIQELREKSSF